MIELRRRGPFRHLCSRYDRELGNGEDPHRLGGVRVEAAHGGQHQEVDRPSAHGHGLECGQASGGEGGVVSHRGQHGPTCGVFTRTGSNERLIVNAQRLEVFCLIRECCLCLNV